VARRGLIRRAQALHQLAHETRQQSREIVARCVEARILRDNRRSAP
jgi:hypothetical protein